MKKILVGAGLSAVVGLLGYFVQPEVLSRLVTSYPALAVVAPLVTLVIGWLLPQLKVLAGSEAPKPPVS